MGWMREHRCAPASHGGAHTDPQHTKTGVSLYRQLTSGCSPLTAKYRTLEQRELGWLQRHPGTASFRTAKKHQHCCIALAKAYLDKGIPCKRSFGMGMLGSSWRTCLSLFSAAGVTASTTCDIILVLGLLQPTTAKPVVVVGGARASKASPTASSRRLLQGRFMSTAGFSCVKRMLDDSVVQSAVGASAATKSGPAGGGSRGKEGLLGTRAPAPLSQR